jgi:hypothetical protein
VESLLKKSWIKKIHIGPRQILFGLEMDDARLTDLVLSCITRQCIADGQARLHAVIEELTTENKLQAFDILQLIFGFVHELKVGFYHDNQPVTAPETKKALTTDPSADIRIVLNKQVPSSLFQAVQQVFHSMNVPLAENRDQHAFAFAVLNRIRQWHMDLQTLYACASADGYPGSDRIRELLALTAQLLENQTAHALLTNCYEQAVPLSAAADDIQKIQSFGHLTIQTIDTGAAVQWYRGRCHPVAAAALQPWVFASFSNIRTMPAVRRNTMSLPPLSDALLS